MEKQFNKEAKQGWRFAADAARNTDEKASSKDRMHTSGGVFVANRLLSRSIYWQRRRSGHIDPRVCESFPLY